MKLEEALNQMNYWKDSCANARREYSARVDDLTKQIAELTRQLNDANKRARQWEEKHKAAGGR